MEQILQVKTRREPGVWKSLGSEAEVAELTVVETRPLVNWLSYLTALPHVLALQIKMLISRRRRLFGAPFKFGDSVVKEESDAYTSTIDIKSVPANVEAELHRLERSIGVQANPTHTDTASQTHWFAWCTIQAISTHLSQGSASQFFLPNKATRAGGRAHC